ncbi:hypothetical protein PVK06_030155 [Gossypium arboreum]|uniref:Uncharacterized protein n=1 Tax=Gossypium arboreum TaxID=29729 RepID=A0ABR0NQM8_GOSAR|nr:hypothetical protein PVK06_030155 [Gossypium arboreum]
MAWGATCVQRLDGSRDSVIHTKYRISLRSSSMREPRYPLPRVVLYTLRQKNNITEALTPRTVRRQEMCPFFHFDSLARFAPGVCSFCIEEVDPNISPHPMGRGTTGPVAPTRGDGNRRRCTRTTSDVVYNAFTGRSARKVSTMILPQVHLRKPCYDFSFI